MAVLGLSNTDMLFYMCVLLVGVVLKTSGVEGNCIYPEDPDPGNTKKLKTENGTYAVGDYAVWECKDKEGRFGVIPVKCESGGWQSATDLRKCAEAMPIEAGAISGIVFASFTIVITVFAIIFSHCTRKKKDEDDEDEKKE